MVRLASSGHNRLSTVNHVCNDPDCAHDAKSVAIINVLSRAELVFVVQQRFAVFTLIDYFLDWRCLTDVLWRISQCSDAQLGLDLTAHRLLPGGPEYQLMTDASKSLESDLNHVERDFDPDEVPTQEICVFSYVRAVFARSLDPLWPR